jgi:YfiH family protein
MFIQSASGVKFFQFESFEKLPVQHAIFTREGGVSPAPWHSLNVGGTVGDDIDRVRTNRARCFQVVHRDVDSLYDVWQVHSADYVLVEQPRYADPYVKADILLTSNPDVTLFMRFADCVPIMLVDPDKHAIAMVHAGWLGTVRGAALAAVKALQNHYGSRTESILAGLGPAIGPDHYEVGSDVHASFLEAFPDQNEHYFQKRDGKLFLDLWSANESQLRSLGIEHVELAQICTACDVRHWFSHRAEGGKTGRFGALLALSF